MRVKFTVASEVQFFIGEPVIKEEGTRFSLVDSNRDKVSNALPVKSVSSLTKKEIKEIAKNRVKRELKSLDLRATDLLLKNNFEKSFLNKEAASLQGIEIKILERIEQLEKNLIEAICSICISTLKENSLIGVDDVSSENLRQIVQSVEKYSKNLIYWFTNKLKSLQRVYF